MSLNERGESRAPAVEDGRRPADAPDRPFEFRGPFFSSREAAAYVCSKTLRGFYEWARRHGLPRRSNGSIAKVDLDRILRRKRAKRTVLAASLANLRKRHAG